MKGWVDGWVGWCRLAGAFSVIVKSSQASSPALLRTRCDVTGLGSCLLLLVAMLVIAGVVLLTLPAPELQAEADLTWATLLHHERQTWKRCLTMFSL